MNNVLHLEPAALTIYFDGACPVCSREIAFYRRQPGADACAWVDAAACAEPALGPGLTRNAALGRFHVRRPDGELVGGMRGFVALWQVLPRSAWLGRLASFGPMPALLDAAYRTFLALRPWWRRAPQALPPAGLRRPAEIAMDQHSDRSAETGQPSDLRTAPTSTSDIATYSPEPLPARRV